MGTGGGFLVVPALVLIGGLPMEVAVGTSLVVIAMKSFAGFAGYLGHVHVDWSLAAVVTTAAVIGSLGGGALASRVSAERLRKGFAWFVVTMAFFLLGQEVPRALGLEPPLSWVLLGTTVAVALVALVTRLLERPRPTERKPAR